MTEGFGIAREARYSSDYELKVEQMSEGEKAIVRSVCCVKCFTDDRHIALNWLRYEAGISCGFTDKQLQECFDDFGWLKVRLKVDEEVNLLNVLGKGARRKSGLVNAIVQLSQLPNGAWVAGSEWNAKYPTFHGCCCSCSITGNQYTTREAAIWSELDPQYLTAEEIRLLGEKLGISDKAIYERMLSLDEKKTPEPLPGQLQLDFKGETK